MDAKAFLSRRPHLITAPTAPATVMCALALFGTSIGALAKSGEREQGTHRNRARCP